jgi:SulP family sulfate permease
MMQFFRYSISDFTHNVGGNLYGGVTAAVIALPLALAFGISSGIGPVAGLYGAIVVGLFAAIFGGTRSQISGPTGPMTVVMTAMTAQFVSQYPGEGISLAFTAVVLGGLIQMLMGVLRLGKYIIMVPYPVISGFMTGIGVIIITLQVGPLLGYQSGGDVLTAFINIGSQITNPNKSALLIGMAALVLLFLWRGKANSVLPAPLAALIAASIGAGLMLPEGSFETIGAIPLALPSIQLPVFRADVINDIVLNAIMLAALGSIDSLLTSLVADNMSAEKHDSDQELIGQGLGNTIAGLVGGLPGSGATMRTVVNIRAGGDGPLSGVIHAVILLLASVGMGFIFESIPVAALSAVLIKVGVDIIDWPFLRRLKQLPRFTLGLMLLVLALTVFVDLITAVFVGVFIKNMMVLDRLSDLEFGHVIIDDGSSDSSQISTEDRRLLRQHQGDVLLLRITGPLSYAVSRRLNYSFNALTPPKVLLIELSSASIIGVSTTLALEQLIKTMKLSGATVKLIDNNESARREFRRLGLLELVGEGNCMADFETALSSIKRTKK